MKKLFAAWNRLGLITQIVIGLCIGILLAWLAPDKAAGISLFGTLFVDRVQYCSQK